MAWWNELSEGAVELGEDAVDWVSDKATDAVDAASDWGMEMVDRVTDWARGEEAPVIELESAPTEDQVRDALETIREILMEGYCRQYAYDRFGHAPALRHQTDFGLVEYQGGYVEQSGSTFIVGYFRRSDTLGFLMPIAIPDELADLYTNGEMKQSYWPDTTVDDDNDIHREAQAATIVRMGILESEFSDLLGQCDLPAMNELLSQLNSVGQQAKNIDDTHASREGWEIMEMWQQWDGADAEAFVEVYGENVQTSMAAHVTGAGVLAYAASAEATAQAHAMTQAYNNIAGAWELILERLSSSSAADKAVSKFVGSFVVNRIPFASDVVATTDFIVEVSTDGEVNSPVSSFFNGIVDRLTGKDVPDGETCEEIYKMLLDATEDLIEGLDESRKKYTDEVLRNEAEEWDRRWIAGSEYELIPGYQGE